MNGEMLEARLVRRLLTRARRMLGVSAMSTRTVKLSGANC